VAKSTLNPEWNDAVHHVQVGDDVTFQVWDEDVAVDDPIGEYKLIITQKLLDAGETKLTFGQVKELRIAFVSKIDPNTLPPLEKVEPGQQNPTLSVGSIARLCAPR